MENLHVLMTSHSDINCIELLINELPFIKKYYDTFLVESVPQPLSNQKLLDYLRNVMLTYKLDLTEVAAQLNISKDHILALNGEYSRDMTDEEKMFLKYEAVKELKTNNNLAFNAQINHFFYQFSYYHYLSQAKKNGIELIGIEHPSYYPGMGQFQINRDNEIVSNTLKITQQNKRCLMLVGASHGVDLIKNFKSRETIKNSYTHLYCESLAINPKTPGNLFRIQIESGAFVLAGNQSYSYYDLSNKTKSEQSLILEKRIVTANSKKPTYQEYGRTSTAEASSFCRDLSSLSGLSFFTTVDKDYFADAVCALNTQESKKLAQNVQQKTGLGNFFNTNNGNSVFVIKNTNTERLDILRKVTMPDAW